MLRIYLVPPGTGYFFACVCILIATAALYVGAGVAAGFPPHYGALTPEAYVENYGIGEIHTVFPPFYNFRMRQNLWPNALAKLCGAAL